MITIEMTDNECAALAILCENEVRAIGVAMTSEEPAALVESAQRLLKLDQLRQKLDRGRVSYLREAANGMSLGEACLAGPAE